MYSICILRSFYKHVLGLPIDYLDIEAVEPDYYKSLKQILEVPLEDLGLELTFSAEAHTFGWIEVSSIISYSHYYFYRLFYRFFLKKNGDVWAYWYLCWAC